MITRLSPPELAQRWGILEKTLANWRIAKKGPPYIKLGDGRNGKVVYRLEDIEKWEQDRMRSFA